jgi:hypothetical protein
MIPDGVGPHLIGAPTGDARWFAALPKATVECALG